MLLDLEMDDMNGFEVLGALQREPRYRDVEVLVVTGRARSCRRASACCASRSRSTR